MDFITIKTSKGREVIDITDRIQKYVSDKNFREGVCMVFVTHTTAALTTADLDPGTDQDMLDAFEATMPKLRYRHPHDPSHVTEHILAAWIGPSVLVPVHQGKLVLGTWQSIVLLEFSGPRERRLTVSLLMEEN